MWANTGLLNPFTAATTTANIAWGTGLAVVGAAMAITATVEMYKKMDQEFRCATAGGKLVNQGVNVLREVVTNHQGIDAELMGELGDLYDGVNEETADVIADAESDGSTATTSKKDEAHLTGKGIDVSTGRNIGEAPKTDDDGSGENA